MKTNKTYKSRKIIGLTTGGRYVVPLTVGEPMKKIIGLHVEDNVVLPKQNKNKSK